MERGGNSLPARIIKGTSFFLKWTPFLILLLSEAILWAFYLGMYQLSLLVTLETAIKQSRKEESGNSEKVVALTDIFTGVGHRISLWSLSNGGPNPVKIGSMMSCWECYNPPLQPLGWETMTRELHRRSHSCLSRCAQAYPYRICMGISLPWSLGSPSGGEGVGLMWGRRVCFTLGWSVCAYYHWWGTIVVYPNTPSWTYRMDASCWSI